MLHCYPKYFIQNFTNRGYGSLYSSLSTAPQNSFGMVKWLCVRVIIIRIAHNILQNVSILIANPIYKMLSEITRKLMMVKPINPAALTTFFNILINNIATWNKFGLINGLFRRSKAFVWNLIVQNLIESMILCHTLHSFRR